VFFPKVLKSQCIFGRTTKSILCVPYEILNRYPNQAQSSSSLLFPPYITLPAGVNCRCYCGPNAYYVHTMCIFYHPTRLSKPYPNLYYVFILPPYETSTPYPNPYDVYILPSYETLNPSPNLCSINHDVTIPPITCRRVLRSLLRAKSASFRTCVCVGG